VAYTFVHPSYEPSPPTLRHLSDQFVPRISLSAWARFMPHQSDHAKRKTRKGKPAAEIRQSQVWQSHLHHRICIIRNIPGILLAPNSTFFRSLSYYIQKHKLRNLTFILSKVTPNMGNRILNSRLFGVSALKLFNGFNGINILKGELSCECSQSTSALARARYNKKDHAFHPGISNVHLTRRCGVISANEYLDFVSETFCTHINVSFPNLCHI
jgi:hypothetical protein